MQNDSLALRDIEKAATLSPGNDTYQERVAQYYIGSGNYDKANTIADPHVNTNQRALLTSKASSGENTRITNARISQTSNNADGTVSAQLTYTLEGKEVNGNFTIKDNKVSVEFSE